MNVKKPWWLSGPWRLCELTILGDDNGRVVIAQSDPVQYFFDSPRNNVQPWNRCLQSQHNKSNHMRILHFRATELNKQEEHCTKWWIYNRGLQSFRRPITWGPISTPSRSPAHKRRVWHPEPQLAHTKSRNDIQLSAIQIYKEISRNMLQMSRLRLYRNSTGQREVITLWLLPT